MHVCKLVCMFILSFFFSFSWLLLVLSSRSCPLGLGKKALLLCYTSAKLFYWVFQVVFMPIIYLIIKVMASAFTVKVFHIYNQYWTSEHEPFCLGLTCSLPFYVCTVPSSALLVVAGCYKKNSHLSIKGNTAVRDDGFKESCFEPTDFRLLFIFFDPRADGNAEVWTLR